VEVQFDKLSPDILPPAQTRLGCHVRADEARSVSPLVVLAVEVMGVSFFPLHVVPAHLEVPLIDAICLSGVLSCHFSQLLTVEFEIIIELIGDGSRP